MNYNWFDFEIIYEKGRFPHASVNGDCLKFLKLPY